MVPVGMRRDFSEFLQCEGPDMPGREAEPSPFSTCPLHPALLPPGSEHSTASISITNGSLAGETNAMLLPSHS